MTSAFDKRLDTILTTGLTPLLLSRGFRKSGLTYRSTQGELVWLIDVQKSQWNAEDETRFTINGGIYIPGVVSGYIGRQDPKRPSLTACCLSARIGMLTESRLDEWWKLTRISRDCDAQIATVVADRVATVLLPFLAKFHDRNDLADYLSAPLTFENKLVAPYPSAQRHAYAALIYAGDGHASKAQTEIKRAVQEAQGKPNQDAIEALSKRLVVRM